LKDGHELANSAYMLFNKRTWLIAGFLSLPGLALLIWWVSVQVYLHQIPPLRWDLPARGMICWGDSDLSGARPGDPPPQRVSETPPGTLPAGHAAFIAWHVIHKHIDAQTFPHFLFYGEGPTLVQATFPDGERRLAWRRTDLISEDEMGMSGVAAAVYLDAATGEPLALIRDVSVCEPSWSPLFLSPQDNKYILAAWLQTSGQFVLLALYVALVLFSLGVISVIRWLRRRKRPPA
jgi:hypothetical protein